MPQHARLSYLVRQAQLATYQRLDQALRGFGLTPAQYTVRAESTGFKTVERTNITLGVGAAFHVDLQLQPGEQNQTVTVTGEVQLVDTVNEVISNTASSRL